MSLQRRRRPLRPMAGMASIHHIITMKLATALVWAIALEACSRQEDYTWAAKECVRDQLFKRKKVTLSSQAMIARRCDLSITYWALRSTQRAYGSDFDLRSARVKAEYAARKNAIIQALLPLQDGSPVY